MDQQHDLGHRPVRRWRTGFLRVQCRCGEPYPCEAGIAWQQYQAAVAEARAWRDEERSNYTASVDNWWENPR